MFLSNTIGQKLEQRVSTHSLNLVRICKKGSSHPTLEKMRKSSMRLRMVEIMCPANIMSTLTLYILRAIMSFQSTSTTH